MGCGGCWAARVEWNRLTVSQTKSRVGALSVAIIDTTISSMSAAATSAATMRCRRRRQAGHIIMVMEY